MFEIIGFPVQADAVQQNIFLWHGVFFIFFLLICFCTTLHVSRLPSSVVCELPVVARLGDGLNKNLGEILNDIAMW